MSTLARHTPLAPKRAKPRRQGRAECSFRFCKTRPRVLGLCLTHAMRRADQLVGTYVKRRDKGCIVPAPEGTGHHGGSLQWSHLISRRYHATRWMPEASVAMCAAHHVYYTHHPLEFEEFANFWLGPGEFLKLKRKALEGGRPDLETIIRSFGDES